MVDDPRLFTDPVARGANAAKYIAPLSPVGAFTGALFAFRADEWWGMALGIMASLYLVFWIVANASAQVLVTVRNWYATHREIREHRAPVGREDSLQAGPTRTKPADVHGTEPVVPPNRPPDRG